MRRSRADKPSLNWKATRGPATTLEELGSPDTTTNYLLCVYDQSSGPLVSESLVPAGGNCGVYGTPKPCWRPKSGGWQYKGRSRIGGRSSGLRQLTLRPGPEGSTKLFAIGDKPELDLRGSLEMTGTVTVQLHRPECGLCWSTAFATPVVNERTEYKAKTP
jgi:hypothetical protein